MTDKKQRPDERLEILFAFFERERATVERIHNWAAWSSDGSAPRHSCFSLEGRYVSPPNDDDRQPRLFVDIRDAIAVNRALVGGRERAPAAAMLSLAGWFIHRQTGAHFARWMRAHGVNIARIYVEETVRDAVLVARNRLARHK